MHFTTRRSAPTSRRRSPTGAAAVLAGAAALCLSVPAPALAGARAAVPSASQAAAQDGPVGGPLLASKGVVVRRNHGAPALPTGLTASSWLVADLDTGDVLAARNAHGRFLPASTLKTLTAVTLIPKIPPRTVITATDAGLAGIPLDSSRVGVVPKMRYHAYQLLEAMMMVSGNDAANTLALGYGGVAKTVAAMNDEAAYLHADDTHAMTTNGLDAKGQLTSAYDLALIGRAGMALPEFRKYAALKMDNFPAPHGKHFQIFTHNKLLLRYPGAIGIKPGYTVAAQATYVGAARRGGHTLIVTMMHAAPHPWNEATALLNWGFAALGKVTPVGRLVEPGTPPAPSGAPAAGDGSHAGGGPLVASSRPAARRSTTDMATFGAVAIGVVVLGGGSMQLRSRRRRRRPRYSLPKF